MELERIRNLENVIRHRQEICKALGTPFTDGMVTDDYFLGKLDGRQIDYLDYLELINRGFCPLCGHEPIGRKYYMRLGVDSKGLEYLCKECDERTGGGRPFLRTYGSYMVYLAFFLGLGVDGPLAYYYLENGRWLMAVWALFAILILPKATLGLISVVAAIRSEAGGKPISGFDMPLIFWNIFPGTMRRYVGVSSWLPFGVFGRSALRDIVREVVWLGIGLSPAVNFFMR